MTILKKKWDTMKIYYERGFNFLLQYVACDTEQRSVSLTFPKGIIFT